MNSEGLVRCTYWLGRARALAAMNDSQEISEMLDKAVDSLCEALSQSSQPLPPLQQTPNSLVRTKDVQEWME